MKLKIWSKTLLMSYRFLERVCGAIDKIVKSSADRSKYYSINYAASNDVFSITNEIIDLTERKINLINLKLLIENILVSIKKDFAVLLINKYINCKSGNQIKEILHLSERTYFRRCNQAIESFEKALIRMGYDEKKLENMLKEQKWIKDVFVKLEIEELKNYVQSNSIDTCEECIFKSINSSIQKLSIFS